MSKMRLEQKSSVKNSVNRLMFCALLILAQVAWFLWIVVRVNMYSTITRVVASVLAITLALIIYGSRTNNAFKMPWIILILSVPVLGIGIFALFGYKRSTKRMHRRFEEIDPTLLHHLEQDAAVMGNLEQQDFDMANQFRYVLNATEFPVYGNTEVTFYPEAYAAYDAQIEEMAKAQSFIFLEYHAIQEAEAFVRLRDVLADRAAAGVEIRILYDDVGSIGFIDPGFIHRMEEIGVQSRMFNPVVPFLNLFMNNRDHRKITVIDGRVGFTGGYNLADEYFNITHPYGYWKDTGIRLVGEAVESMTVMFLEMWNAMSETDTDYSKYMVPCKDAPHCRGYVQPYADSPLDDEPVGENVYLNLVKHAKHYLWVMTPYLIISDEMNRELTLAAQRGVDVRVFTPGIPDKKFVYRITRSYYNGLVRKGVRVYEYTPGFLHSKQMICDGEAATVGTINLDYRSLYHHFENGTLMYHTDSIADIRRDFDETMAQCEEVTEKYRDRKQMLRISQCIWRMFAPLL